MNKVTSKYGKYMSTGYCILTVFITWICIYGALGFNGIMHLNEIPGTSPSMIIVYLATLAGPFISGLVFNLICKSVKENYSKISIVKVDIKWYAYALLTAPVSFITILLVLSVIDKKYMPVFFNADSKLSLAVISIFMGLLVGFFEEAGWTGYAVPTILKKHSLFRTGITVGIVWGIWHFPLFISSANNIENWFLKLCYMFILLFSFLVPYRILMVYLYSKTKSLFLVILMHAPLAGGQLVFLPEKLSTGETILFDITIGLLFWIIAIFVLRKKES